MPRRGSRDGNSLRSFPPALQGFLLTPLDTFRSHWLPQERRALTDRRAVRERRRAVLSVTVERRRSDSRRSGADRRETAVGHVRNALQLLQVLSHELTLDAEQRGNLERAIRRLWLAVAEAERPEPGRRT